MAEPERYCDLHHTCECDDCINRGGGAALAGAGRTYPSEEPGPVQQMRSEMRVRKSAMSTDNQSRKGSVTVRT